MSLGRRIERKRALAEIKAAANRREQLGDTTLRVIGLLQASPLESRRNFAVDLFRDDPLAERIETAWRIIRGQKREPDLALDEHELEAV